MGIRLNREYRIKFYLNARHFIIIDGHKGETHPHTWEMVLDIRFGRSSFVEFRTFERGISDYLSKYQNRTMNDIAPFDSVLPTLENIVDVFAEDFYTIIHDIGGVLTRIEASDLVAWLSDATASAGVTQPADYNTATLKTWLSDSANAYAYAYGATIGDSGWGDWPGIKLIQSNANPSLFYSADLSDKSLGNGTVIFNNSSDQLEEVSISISNGDKWLLKNGSFVRGTIDSLSGGDSLDVGRLPSLPASLEAEVTVVGVYKSVWATAPEKAYIHVYDGSESVPNVDWPGREMKNGGEYFYFAIPAAWFNDESKITVIVHDNNGEGGKVYSEKQVEKTKNIFVTSNNEAEPWN